ncbi:MAG TPA: S9 family peptidase [Flavipsychrobacter sp.]|nr:S9 family peptidase [Flavipsychrobacter sp.]
MKKLLLPLLLLLSVIGNAQDRMTPELLWSLKQVNGEGMSPDAKTVFYSARTYDVKTEKSTTKFYALSLKTGERSERKETKSVFQREEAVWYATDNKAIHKSSDKGKHWQSIYTGVEGIDNIRISPDGRYIAFTKDILIKPVLAKDIYPDLPKSTAHIYTDLTYRHWDTWEDGKFSHLFIAPLNGGKAIDLMVNEPYDVPQKPFGGAEDYIWSPDGKGLVYVCKKKYGKEYAQSTNTDIYYYDIAKKQTINLTANMMGYDMAPAFSPDGQYLAWTSMRRDGYEADKNDIYVMDVKKRSALKLNLTQGWDGTVNSFIWSNDGKKILFSAPWEGTEQLFDVNFPGYTRMLPAVHKITEGKFDVNGLIGQSGNEAIITRSDMNHANELFTVDLNSGDMRQLTHENDQTYSSIKLSKTELRRIRTEDNHTMGVWVIYPPDFDPAKKYPTLLYCQGGPQSALSQFYSFRWNFQLMAANGYIIVAPNRRGMPGWGVKWNEVISKDWGGEPMQDYLTAIDALSQEPYVDVNRLGCVGASYGGYSVYMLAGMHNNRFKTFIAHDGLFDLKSWYGTTEELWFANWDIGGPYWQKPQPKGYEKFNPSNYVDKWNTPIMIVQGGIDYRVPIEQGLEAFQAAQLRGIKSKLLYLPNENHWVLHPQNALVWQREFFNWLKETL